MTESASNTRLENRRCVCKQLSTAKKELKPGPEDLPRLSCFKAAKLTATGNRTPKRFGSSSESWSPDSASPAGSGRPTDGLQLISSTTGVTSKDSQLQITSESVEPVESPELQQTAQPMIGRFIYMPNRIRNYAKRNLIGRHQFDHNVPINFHCQCLRNDSLESTL